MNFLALLKRPSAYVPLAMSLAALATVLLAVALGVTAHSPTGTRPDEGAAAHIFQLLMISQVPFILFFAARWLRSSLTSALQVLLLQAAAAVAALAPVFLLRL